MPVSFLSYATQQHNEQGIPMNPKTTTDNVVQLHPKEALESDKKWGPAVMKLGYSMVPSLIFWAQARLNLSPVQLVLLLHLADFWWHRDQMPFPSKAELSERMNLSQRQIQRHMAQLEADGFIERNPRFHYKGGQQNNEYNMNGLVSKLKKLEPEFTKVKEEAKQKAKAVAKPGGLIANQTKKAGKGKNE
jgi:DNA-binding transcriptional ArsR family regulator